MPRLSPIDQAFLLLETPERPMNVGALIALLPPPGSRGRFADRFVSGMLKRPVGPPFNCRIRPGPVRPLLALEEDARMDPAPQVHRHALPRGSDLKTLFRRICEVHVRLLPRDQPLWQLHVFTGLPGGRVALYFKTHHGLIDGIGFIRIVTGLVAQSAASATPRAIWEGLPAVTSQGGTRPAAAGGAMELLRFADEARRTTNDMLRLVWHVGMRGLGLGHGLSLPFVATPDVLKAEPSSNRVLAHCSVSLQRVREMARRSATKINDVMLAALDVAMNRYLEERGCAPDHPLVADIPVALQDDGGAGNRITILQVPMGRPGSGPAERLRQVFLETQEMKQEVRSLSGGSLMLYSILEHSLASTIESLRLGQLPMLANLVVSNPAGLDRRVYLGGAEVELALPVSVVAHHQVLNVTVTTYMDDLHVTFIALREAIPDLEKLAGYTVEAVAAIEAGLAPAAHRPRKRRRKATSMPAPARRAARQSSGRAVRR